MTIMNLFLTHLGTSASQVEVDVVALDYMVTACVSM